MLTSCTWSGTFHATSPSWDPFPPQGLSWRCRTLHHQPTSCSALCHCMHSLGEFKCLCSSVSITAQYKIYKTKSISISFCTAWDLNFFIAWQSADWTLVNSLISAIASSNSIYWKTMSSWPKRGYSTSAGYMPVLHLHTGIQSCCSNCCWLSWSGQRSSLQAWLPVNSLMLLRTCLVVRELSSCIKW